MNKTATVASVSVNQIPVIHSIRPDVNREFLTVSVDGWDEVKTLCKKILVFDGKEFVFSGWNSDRNECFFYRFIIIPRPFNKGVATIKS